MQPELSAVARDIAAWVDPGLKWWPSRDRSITISIPGSRGEEDDRNDHYLDASVLTPRGSDLELLVFSVPYERSRARYTLNLRTLRPTGNSQKQDLLPGALRDRLARALEKRRRPFPREYFEGVAFG